jgi:hypothetical protein
MVNQYKNTPGEKESFDQFSTHVHAWYTANKNGALESEIIAIFKRIRSLTA